MLLPAVMHRLGFGERKSYDLFQEIIESETVEAKIRIEARINND